MDWLNEPYGYFLNCKSILEEFINSLKTECTDEHTCLELACVGDGALDSCLVAPSLSSAAVSAPAPRTAHWFCHRDRQKEIDDHVGKWQAGEKLTCKWCRERDRRREGGSFVLCICGCRERRYVWRVLVTAQQLLHVCLRGKGGKPRLFCSSFEKQPYPVAWCCCHGVGLFWKGEREQKLWVAVNIIGKGAIISPSLSCWPFSLVVSWPLK